MTTPDPTQLEPQLPEAAWLPPLSKAEHEKAAVDPTLPARTTRRTAVTQFAAVKTQNAEVFPIAIVVDVRGRTVADALAEFERSVTLVRVQARALIALEENKAVEAAAHARKEAAGE